MRLIHSVVLLASLTIPSLAFADTINLSTGTAAYFVFGPEDQFAPVAAKTIAMPNAGWQAPITGASWINESGSGSASDAAGEYDYHTHFVLTGAGSLSGSFASDNNGYVCLSEIGVSGCTVLGANQYGSDASTYSFNTATPFSATLGAGTYNLFFVITNGNGGSDGDGPTGLLAQASVVTPSATPEPSSMVLLGTGLLAVAGFGRRKFLKA